MSILLRNQMLKQTDYYMLTDVYEVSSDTQKQDLSDYRQSLRNFINENKDKYSIDGINFIGFPEPPSWVKVNMPKY